MAINIEYVIAMLIGMIYAILVTIRLLWESIRKGPRVFFGPPYRKRPEILSDPKYGKSGFLHLKDVTLHYMEKGDRSKPLVLLVHGYPEFWFSWRHQLTSELAEKFHLVAIDQRGYNESDKPTHVSDYKMNKLVGDLKQVIELLGHSDCYLVGHDWGGAVSWMFATAHPSMVKKLAVLNIPHPSAIMKAQRNTLSQFLKSWYMLMFQIPCFPEWFLARGDLEFLSEALTSPKAGVKPGMISDTELEAFKYIFQQPGAMTPPLNYYRAAFRYRQMDRGEGEREKLKMPVRLIFGVNDVALTVEAAKNSANYCENFDLHLVEGASHWVQQDEPEIVNRKLIEFFR